MRFGKNSSLWILAFAASACIAEHKLGDDGQDDAAGNAGTNNPPPGERGGNQGTGGAADRAGNSTPGVGGKLTPATGGSNRPWDEPGTGGTNHQEPLVDAAIDRGVPDGDASRCIVSTTIYGPRPCQTNLECEDWNGAGWYCDTNHRYADGCGGWISWPSCKKSIDDAGTDVKVDARTDACLSNTTIYGPQPCQNDRQCTTQGANWYCDTTNAYLDSCGNSIIWPTCKARIDDGSPGPVLDACAPTTIYGPPPCQSDAVCVQEHGAGWYCDSANAFTDPCGGEVSWPTCKERK